MTYRGTGQGRQALEPELVQDRFHNTQISSQTAGCLSIRRDSALNPSELSSCSVMTSERGDRLPLVTAMLGLPQGVTYPGWPRGQQE
jgi:hypothetical protein